MSGLMLECSLVFLVRPPQLTRWQIPGRHGLREVCIIALRVYRTRMATILYPHPPLLRTTEGLCNSCLLDRLRSILPPVDFYPTAKLGSLI